MRPNRRCRVLANLRAKSSKDYAKGDEMCVTDSCKSFSFTLLALICWPVEWPHSSKQRYIPYLVCVTVGNVFCSSVYPLNAYYLKLDTLIVHVTAWVVCCINIESHSYTTDYRFRNLISGIFIWSNYFFINCCQEITFGFHFFLLWKPHHTLQVHRQYIIVYSTVRFCFGRIGGELSEIEHLTCGVVSWKCPRMMVGCMKLISCVSLC